MIRSLQRLALRHFAGLGTRQNTAALRSRHAFWQYNREVAHYVLEAFGLEGPLTGLHLLDVGCGDGGKTAFYAERGARVTGIDLDPDRVATATAYGRTSSAAAKAEFVVGSVAAMPFADGAFDAAISNSVMEHLPIGVVAAALRETRRVVRPGGHFYLRIHPYRAPDGAHLHFYLPADWAHLWAPESLVLEAWRDCYRAQYTPEIDWFFAKATVDGARQLNDVCWLNRLSIATYDRCIADAGWQVVRFDGSNRRWTRHLRHLPGLREYVTGHAVYTLLNPG